MANNDKNEKNKKLYYCFAVFCGVAVVAVAVFFGLKFLNETEKNNNGVQKSETEQVVEKNSEAIEPTNVQNTSTDEDVPKVKQYEGEDPNKSESLSGVVTYAGVNGDTLMIRTSIDQYLTSGTCKLTLEKDGVTIYDSIANIMGNVNTATCDGFDISAAELGGGEIEIIINLSANEKVGEIRGKVNI